MLSAKNIQAMNGFEKVFIIFAAAFTLEEYTASKEHGWSSTCQAYIYPFRLINVVRPCYQSISPMYAGKVARISSILILLFPPISLAMERV